MAEMHRIIPNMHPMRVSVNKTQHVKAKSLRFCNYTFSVKLGRIELRSDDPYFMYPRIPDTVNDECGLDITKYLFKVKQLTPRKFYILVKVLRKCHQDSEQINKSTVRKLIKQHLNVSSPTCAAGSVPERNAVQSTSTKFHLEQARSSRSVKGKVRSKTAQPESDATSAPSSKCELGVRGRTKLPKIKSLPRRTERVRTAIIDDNRIVRQNQILRQHKLEQEVSRLRSELDNRKFEDEAIYASGIWHKHNESEEKTHIGTPHIAIGLENDSLKSREIIQNFFTPKPAIERELPIRFPIEICRSSPATSEPQSSDLKREPEFKFSGPVLFTIGNNDKVDPDTKRIPLCSRDSGYATRTSSIRSRRSKT